MRTGIRRSLAVVAAAGLLAVACEHVPVAGAPDCRLTPVNNYWRADVRNLPVHSRSTAYINNIGANATLKADFGSGLWDGGPIGIPYVVVPGTQPKVPITFKYWDESDPGPYPIPVNPPIEGGERVNGRSPRPRRRQGPLHLLRDLQHLQRRPWRMEGRLGRDVGHEARTTCIPTPGPRPTPLVYRSCPGSSATRRWPAGKVLHAIRITVPTTQDAYVWPARHKAGATTNLNYPPMGTWLRLSPTIDPNSYDPMVRPIVVALQTYGAIVADNGSSWYMSGAPDERWDNDKLRQLARIKGSDFQVVNTASLIVDPNSGQATTAK